MDLPYYDKDKQPAEYAAARAMYQAVKSGSGLPYYDKDKQPAEYAAARSIYKAMQQRSTALQDQTTAVTEGAAKTAQVFQPTQAPEPPPPPRDINWQGGRAPALKTPAEMVGLMAPQGELMESRVEGPTLSVDPGEAAQQLLNAPNAAVDLLRDRLHTGLLPEELRGNWMAELPGNVAAGLVKVPYAAASFPVQALLAGTRGISQLAGGIAGGVNRGLGGEAASTLASDLGAALPLDEFALGAIDAVTAGIGTPAARKALSGQLPDAETLAQTGEYLTGGEFEHRLKKEPVETLLPLWSGVEGIGRKLTGKSPTASAVRSVTEPLERLVVGKPDARLSKMLIDLGFTPNEVKVLQVKLKEQFQQAAQEGRNTASGVKAQAEQALQEFTKAPLVVEAAKQTQTVAELQQAIDAVAAANKSTPEKRWAAIKNLVAQEKATPGIDPQRADVLGRIEQGLAAIEAKGINSSKRFTTLRDEVLPKMAEAAPKSPTEPGVITEGVLSGLTDARYELGGKTYVRRKPNPEEGVFDWNDYIETMEKARKDARSDRENALVNQGMDPVEAQRIAASESKAAAIEEVKKLRNEVKVGADLSTTSPKMRPFVQAAFAHPLIEALRQRIMDEGLAKVERGTLDPYKYAQNMGAYLQRFLEQSVESAARSDALDAIHLGEIMSGRLPKGFAQIGSNMLRAKSKDIKDFYLQNPNAAMDLPEIVSSTVANLVMGNKVIDALGTLARGEGEFAGTKLVSMTPVRGFIPVRDILAGKPMPEQMGHVREPKRDAKVATQAKGHSEQAYMSMLGDFGQAYVHPSLADAVKVWQATQAQMPLLFRAWKASKTVANVPTYQVTNHLDDSNRIWASDGINLHWGKGRKQFNTDYASIADGLQSGKLTPTIHYAQRNGLADQTFVRDLMAMPTASKQVAKRMGQYLLRGKSLDRAITEASHGVAAEASGLAPSRFGFVNALRKFANKEVMRGTGAAGEPTQGTWKSLVNWTQAMELARRVAYHKMLVAEKGMKPSEATQRVADVLFDYSDLPPLMRKLMGKEVDAEGRRTPAAWAGMLLLANPFLTYPVKRLAWGVKQTFSNPVRAMIYYALNEGMQWANTAQMFDDPTTRHLDEPPSVNNSESARETREAMSEAALLSAHPFYSDQMPLNVSGKGSSLLGDMPATIDAINSERIGLPNRNVIGEFASGIGIPFAKMIATLTSGTDEFGRDASFKSLARKTDAQDFLTGIVNEGVLIDETTGLPTGRIPEVIRQFMPGQYSNIVYRAYPAFRNLVDAVKSGDVESWYEDPTNVRRSPTSRDLMPADVLAFGVPIKRFKVGNLEDRMRAAIGGQAQQLEHQVQTGIRRQPAWAEQIQRVAEGNVERLTNRNDIIDAIIAYIQGR